MSKNILSYFPKGQIPRKGQAQVLQAIESGWDDYDVFVITSPVAAGKSSISYTIAAWANGEKKQSSAITTPTNVLVRQYMQSFPRLFNLERKEAHRCRCYPDFVSHKEANCDYHYKVNGEHCAGCCYVRKVRQAHALPFMVMNLHVMMAHKLNKHVLIADESHNLEATIQGLAAKRIWHRDYGIPSNVTSYGQLHKWLDGNRLLETNPVLRKLWDELDTGRLRCLVEWSVEDRRGHDESCLKLLPLDVSKEKPIFWPQKKTKKLVLLSATFNQIDVQALGLDERRVLYLEAPSPIPPELRPIIYSPQANMALEGQEEGLPKLAEFLKEVADKHAGKGMVHATYALAEKLRPMLQKCSRFLFHDSRSKMAVYQGWRESKGNEILVGCGLSEGIDLYGPEYEFQVLAKVPYPSLEEPAMRYLAEVKPERYAWMTLRTVAQATGRICRGADDFGVTYIVDLQWENLWKNSERYGIVPEWLREGLAAGKQEE